MRKLSPNGHRLLKCECGLIADRDVVGSWNIMLRGLKIDVGVPFPPMPMSGGWKVLRHDCFESYESSGEPERLKLMAISSDVRGEEERSVNFIWAK